MTEEPSSATAEPGTQREELAVVGLVLISHSPALAEGAAALARQIGMGNVPVLPAGGDSDGGLGTSLDLVERAVEAANQGRGVVLIADIGSSVLTAEAFIESVDEDVVLADAPFVEGSVAAAAEAAAGGDLASVAAAARSAYEYRKVQPSA